MFYGSERITEDLDILVRPNTADKLAGLTNAGMLRRGGDGFVVQGVPLDVLAEAVQLFTFEAPGTLVQQQNRVLVPAPVMSLGLKVKCGTYGAIRNKDRRSKDPTFMI